MITITTVITVTSTTLLTFVISARYMSAASILYVLMTICFNHQNRNAGPQLYSKARYMSAACAAASLHHRQQMFAHCVGGCCRKLVTDGAHCHGHVVLSRQHRSHLRPSEAVGGRPHTQAHLQGSCRVPARRHARRLLGGGAGLALEDKSMSSPRSRHCSIARHARELSHSENRKMAIFPRQK